MKHERSVMRIFRLPYFFHKSSQGEGVLLGGEWPLIFPMSFINIICSLQLLLALVPKKREPTFSPIITAKIKRSLCFYMTAIHRSRWLTDNIYNRIMRPLFWLKGVPFLINFDFSLDISLNRQLTSDWMVFASLAEDETLGSTGFTILFEATVGVSSGVRHSPPSFCVGLGHRAGSLGGSYFFRGGAEQYNVMPSLKTETAPLSGGSRTMQRLTVRWGQRICHSTCTHSSCTLANWWVIQCQDPCSMPWQSLSCCNQYGCFTPTCTL